MMLRRYHKKRKVSEEQGEKVTNLEDLTVEELEKVKNDDLKSRLDELKIRYDSSATKKELIKLLIGEETEKAGD